MKALVVEDDFTSRLLLQKFLSPFGECHIAVDGNEAVDAFLLSRENKEPYDLICMDIMMPGLDGHGALKRIREIEETNDPTGPRVRIIMTTALGDKENVFSAFREQCDGYLPKPIYKEKLYAQLESFGLGVLKA